MLEILIGLSDFIDWKLLFSILTPVLIAIWGGRITLKQVEKNVYMTSRVKWVEDFRDLVSKYNSAVMKTSSNISTYNMFESKFIEINNKVKVAGEKGDCKKALEDNRKQTLEWYRVYSESNHEFNILSNKLLLYLDSTNKKHFEIIKLIENIDKLFKTEKEKISCENFCDDLKLVREKSNLIIKKELDRVMPKQVN